ncbi:MAG: sulfotransferase [Blastomonas sp.]
MTRYRDRFDEMHAAAVAATGHDDFGDTRYEEGMRVLLDALDDNPPGGAAAQASADGVISGALSARLITQAGWNANPDYASQPVERPLIVIGLPRTGTTALHQLLSMDPQFQGFERWLTGNPMVRPPRDQWETHPAYQACVQRIEAMRAMAPEIMAAHSTDADEVDECLMPMAQSFVCNWFASNIDVPQYDAWFRNADETPSFLRYREVLKLVGLNDARRWLLKNPSHVFGIDALLNAFPDACIVQTHRHPAASMSSLMSLLGGIRELMTGEPVDRERLLAREAGFWAEGARRSMAAAERLPDRFCHVRQEEIRQDPMKVIEKIYGHFGIPMSAEAEKRFQAWAGNNPPDARSSHSYRQVERESIAPLFADYIARFDLDQIVTAGA